LFFTVVSVLIEVKENVSTENPPTDVPTPKADCTYDNIDC